MSKKTGGYEELFPDIKQIFDTIINATEMDRYMTIKVLAKDTQKKIFTISRANPLMKHETNVDLYVIINQRVFEGLTIVQQVMQAEEILCGVSWDMEKDKLVISKPNVNTYSGVLRKYGYDVAKQGDNSYEVLQESIKSLYDKAKDEDAQEEG